jgi:hypothetical protein
MAKKQFWSGMLAIALLFIMMIVGCGDGGKPGEEGIYIGIIKFAGESEDLTSGVPILLDAAGKSLLTDYIDSQYTIATQNGTSLFYSVHKALANLKNNETRYPANLKSVNIVTFTDGQDLTSDFVSSTNPIEGKTFQNDIDYGDYVKKEIDENRKITGQPVVAYSIGVPGKDVSEEHLPKFNDDLKKIASPEKAKLLNNFDEVQATFNDIAKDLDTNITNFIMISAVLTRGTRVRMTFEQTLSDAEASSRYIEGTMSRYGNTVTFEDIFYGDEISSRAGTGPIIGTIIGTEVTFVFEDIKGYTEEKDKNNTKQWRMPPDQKIWQPNSEYDPEGSSSITKNSIVIYLILDCSRSLELHDISKIKTTATYFINTLYNQYYQTTGTYTYAHW